MRRRKMSARIVGLLFMVATATYMTGTGLMDTLLGNPNHLLTLYPNKIQVILNVFL